MKLGVFTVILRSLPFEKALDTSLNEAFKPLKLVPGPLPALITVTLMNCLRVIRNRKLFYTPLVLVDCTFLVCRFMEILFIPTNKSLRNTMRHLSDACALLKNSKWKL